MKCVREGALLRVTLDTPEQRNVLTTADCRTIAGAVNDPEVNAVLLAAIGPFFCAGLQLGADPGELFEEWNKIPVVAAVQGPAMDEGVALLACAHVVVAAQGTSFAITPARTGTFPQHLYRVLKRAIGARRAMELALTGRVFTVGDALAWGLVHHVAPAFEFDDRADAIAVGLAAHRLCPQDVP